MPWPTGLVVKKGSNICAFTASLIPGPLSEISTCTQSVDSIEVRIVICGGFEVSGVEVFGVGIFGVGVFGKEADCDCNWEGWQRRASMALLTCGVTALTVS